MTLRAMKCKVLKIRLQNESDEADANKFLAAVELKQVFSSIVNENESFWSILAFYEDANPSPKSKSRALEITEKPIDTSAGESPANQPKQLEKPILEPIILTDEQENDFNNLKKWRNQRAAQDGLAPYMIAHNDSLRQIAALPVRNKDELLQVKGFGEKRTEKYGSEILDVLSNQETNI